MKDSRQHKQERKHRAPNPAPLCCSSCRLSSFSSSGEAESSSSRSSDSNRYRSISSIAHAMVQERLDQIIREDAPRAHVDYQRGNKHKGVVRESRPPKAAGTSTRFVVMVAMEKRSYDPREDFRESMVEMIMSKRIEEPKDLRSLLNYYVSMNSEEYHGIILEVFHEVCSDLFSL